MPFVIKPKFALVEPEFEQQSTEERATQVLLARIEEVTGKPVPMKCQSCGILGGCVTVSILLYGSALPPYVDDCTPKY